MKPVDPRLVRYARAARGYFAASALIALLQTGVIIAFAWLLTDAVTGAIAGRDVTGTLLWLLAVVALRGLLIALSDAAGSRAAARTGSQLRSALIAAVGRLGPGWLAERNRAALAVTAGHGLEALDAYFGRYIPQLVLTVITTPVVLAVMWWYDWPSGLIAAATLPLIPLFLVLIGLATRGVQRRQWATLQRMAARFADTVQGLATLRLFGRERRAAGRIEETADQYRRETMKVLRYSFLSGFSMELLSSLAVALIAVTVGFRLLTGDLALEVGLFVLLLAPEAFLPIRQVGVQFHAATEGVAATGDIFAVLDAASETPTSPRVVSPSARPTNGIPPRSVSQESHSDPETKRRTDKEQTLRVSKLRVRRGDVLLPPVSFTLAPREIVLVEGPSGAGKSSVLAALRGAASFEGEAHFDGVDVRALDPADWLAWAGQSPGLLRGTIAENVALGAADADEAKIREALVTACADDLDPAQDLGVQGAGLSGGQAQRVAVARALYRGGRVLVLDEPSSALDAGTEARLWQNLRRHADSGTAILLVSHRRTARTIADRVVDVGVSV